MLKSGFGGGGDASSPLKLFTNAKKKINGIYRDIGNYVSEFHTFVEEIKDVEENELVHQELVDHIQTCAQKVNGIKEMLLRDHMKVVFFGRTSNGKSTVINAMLWDKILPSGLGHTTNCFLSIEGCDDKDGPYLLCDGSEEKRNVKSVSQLGHALSQESMSNDSLIKVCWPKNKCSLLKNEVVLVDSPGIDVTEDMDSWIDAYCLDADVFILVANAESTLMLAEKKFFHKVNERLSKPNIFILNNRWDASAAEPDLMEQVRQQHLERGISFLAKELGVVTPQQAKDRVFFISAKEALNARLQRLQDDIISGMPEAGGALAEGFQARLIEFCTFEHSFEECISRSATRTKFHQHTQCAQDIMKSLLTECESLLKESSRMKQECDEYNEQLENQITFLEKRLKLLTAQAKEAITRLVSETEFQVRQAMSDEIRRLSLLVDEFDQPFHQNMMVLQVYKAELYRHVEEVLGRNLSARCSSSLQKQINKSKQLMLDEAQPLFECSNNSEQEPVLVSQAQNSAFDMSYDINCASLCQDFQEDIEFKFSLGFKCLMGRFIGSRKAIAPSEVPRPISGTGEVIAHQRQQADDSLSLQDILTSVAASYLKHNNSQSAGMLVGIIMVPYALWRTIGWKAIVFTVASYGSLYLYERLTWTSRAQEHALKRQFVEHATEKLNLITTFTSSNCSHQVQQELSTTFAQICHKVDEISKELKSDSEEMQDKSSRLSEIQSKIKTLKNKANFLSGDIDSFVKKFLHDYAV
ncbi:mitofusin-2-like isoform X1 [Styela clava]